MAFCWIYVRKYQSHRESEVVSTITAIFSLAIALITSALLPVDIFLVSYMKNQNGTFKVIPIYSFPILSNEVFTYSSIVHIVLSCCLWESVGMEMRRGAANVTTEMEG